MIKLTKKLSRSKINPIPIPKYIERTDKNSILQTSGGNDQQMHSPGIRNPLHLKS